MNVDHLVVELPDGCHVLVPGAVAVSASEQLRLYQRENPRRKSHPWPAVEPDRGLFGALAYVLLLLAMYFIQARYVQDIDWTTTGELIAGRVRQGEWWRAVTALTLHADAAHVAGNLVFGAFFGYLAGQYLGSGVAWLAIVATAAAGNVANALVQNAGHRSIGASTAVFAALGVVAAFVWGLSRRFSLSWARRWAPVVGAVALLAYIGTGDETTDIVAHLTGFLCGALGGVGLHWIGSPEAQRQIVQAVSGVLAVLIVAVCWVLALSST